MSTTTIISTDTAGRSLGKIRFDFERAGKVHTGGIPKGVIGHRSTMGGGRSTTTGG